MRATLNETEKANFRPQWGPIRRNLEAALFPRHRVKIFEVFIGMGLFVSTRDPLLTTIALTAFIHGIAFPPSKGLDTVGIVTKIDTSPINPVDSKVTVMNWYSRWQFSRRIPTEALRQPDQEGKKVEVQPGDFVKLLETRPFLWRWIPKNELEALRRGNVLQL